MSDNAQDAPFDMPAQGTWEERGGWVVNALCDDFAPLELEHAAGFVGNMGWESRGFTALQEEHPLVEGSAGGIGWPQWTGMGEHGRRRLFLEWCQQQGLDPKSNEANYGYVCEELAGDYAGVLDKVRALTGDPDDVLERAVFIVGRLYEGPAGTTPTHLPAYDGRLQYARRALAGAKAHPPAPVAPPASLPSQPAAAPDSGIVGWVRRRLGV